jgi:undecaprenyl-diphosphatase
MAFDLQLFTLFHSLAGQSPWLDGVIVFCASHLPYLVVIVFFGLVFLTRDKLSLLFVGLGSAVIARFVVVELIRLFYHRIRPFDELSITPLFTSDNWSFPSGHASFFFAVSTAVYLYHKKWGIGFFLATLLITLGRISAGVHYPSDIVGGALVGIASTYAVFYILRKRGVIKPAV